MEVAEAVDRAVRACPFLHSVSQRQGEQYARNLALRPFASAAGGPVLEEEGLSGRLEAAVHKFHGPGGVVPLARFAAPAPADHAAASSSSGCPFHAAAAASAPSAEARRAALSPSPCSAAVRPAACSMAAAAVAAPAAPSLSRVPFASISISGFGFMPDPGQFFNRPSRAKKQQPQQRKPTDPGSSSSSSRGGGGGSSAGGGRTGAAGAATSSPGVSSGGSSGTRSGRLRPGGRGAGHGAGAPRWRQVLGGLIPLAAGGHLTCPAPIVKMRAAIAALKPVRDLRPQALPIRALAMGGTAIAAGLPCGAWREHTRKFSPQWFLAVHATIPFVAMLRKAVLMPRWAILLTLVGSIAGQAVGARLERERLLRLADRRAAGKASLSAGSSATPAPADCVMPGLDAGCARALQAARAAVEWTLAPVVVQ